MSVRQRWLFVAFLVTFASACATDSGEPTDRAGASSATGSGGAGAAGTSAGAGGADDFGNTDMRVAQAPQEIVELPGADGNCGATSVQAEQVIVEEQFEVEEEVTTVEPVAIYLMLDQSGSMVLLWPGVANSVTQFVQDPMSAGVDVAIQYFPAFGECTGTGYDVPEVPMGRLSGHAVNITNSLAAHGPFGIGTPIEGALRGVTRYCQNFQQQNPSEKCIAVFITDGAPSGCNEDHNAIVQIATDAQAAGVTTYAVGLAGSDFTLLNRISMEGGAEDCDPGPQYACDVTAGGDQLVVALNRIREAVTTTVTRIETVTMTVETPLECEWELPAPDNAAQGFDQDQVNVQLTAPGAADATLGKVASAADCVADAWHYDDATSPTRIIACPETCDMIQSTTGAAVDILLGCPTLVIE